MSLYNVGTYARSAVIIPYYMILRLLEFDSFDIILYMTYKTDHYTQKKEIMHIIFFFNIKFKTHLKIT